LEAAFQRGKPILSFKDSMKENTPFLLDIRHPWGMVLTYKESATMSVGSELPGILSITIKLSDESTGRVKRIRSSFIIWLLRILLTRL
jgi:hypothetical protein